MVETIYPPAWAIIGALYGLLFGGLFIPQHPSIIFCLLGSGLGWGIGIYIENRGWG